MQQLEIVLLVDVFQTGMPGAHLGLGAKLVFAAGEVEAVGADAGVEHIVHAAVVARAVLPHLPAIERQALDLLGGDHSALEGLRQRSAVVRAQDRQYHHPLADTHFGFGQLGLRRDGQAAEVIRRMPIAGCAMHRQQAGAVGTATAVELDRQQAQGIHAEPYRTGGVAGLEVEDETLRPLFRLAQRGVGVHEVAVDIEVAQVQ